jgi:hypothetical protein
VSTQKNNPAAISTSTSRCPARTQPKIAATTKHKAAMRCRNPSIPWTVKVIAVAFHKPCFPEIPDAGRTTHASALQSGHLDFSVVQRSPFWKGQSRGPALPRSKRGCAEILRGGRAVVRRAAQECADHDARAQLDAASILAGRFAPLAIERTSGPQREPSLRGRVGGLDDRRCGGRAGAAASRASTRRTKLM